VFDVVNELLVVVCNRVIESFRASIPMNVRAVITNTLMIWEHIILISNIAEVDDKQSMTKW